MNKQAILTIAEVRALSDAEIAEHMRAGGLEIEADGPLSEWGSRAETIARMVEDCVNDCCQGADGAVTSLWQSSNRQ